MTPHAKEIPASNAKPRRFHQLDSFHVTKQCDRYSWLTKNRQGLTK